MNAGELLDRRFGRGFAQQRGELLGFQGVQHGMQPIGAFRVVRPHVVIEACGMGDQGGGHVANPQGP